MKKLMVVLFLTFAVLLAACGDNDTNSNEASNSNAEADDNTVENEENENENVENNEENENAEENENGNESAEEDIELPSAVPSDMPLPDDPTRTTFADEEGEGAISLNTPMTRDDLEVLYEDYYNEHEFSDDVEKTDFPDDEFNELMFSIENDEIVLFTRIVDNDDHRAVTISSVHR